MDRLADRLRERLGRQAIVRAQNPIVLGEHSEPEPNISILVRRDDFYEKQAPGPSDIRLVIEIADSSIDEDRKVKIPLYARHGVPEVWLLDLLKDAVEVYRSPAAGAYSDVQRLTGDRPLTCLAYPELTFTADAVLGR